MTAKKSSRRQKPLSPDERPLTAKQAQRLSSLISIDPAELQKKPYAEVAELAKWRIEPSLLFHRRVCGRVVQEDPATGELWGVPNATVHVEDTDCSFLSFFPVEGPFGWLFPFNCSTEVIATATTDECGNFCVWIPWFDIDYVLRWRKGQLCFPELVPPRLCDILKIDPRIFEEPVLDDPRPLPDPPPYTIDIDRVRSISGDRVADLVEAGLAERSFGANHSILESALQSPTLPLPPPNLPKALERGAPIDAKTLKRVDFDRWIGPYLRCVDIYYPEWSTIIDAPDITFRVTQEISGAETTVYDEGSFQVRWNDNSNDDLELRATGALATPLCDGPEIDPGSCDKPTIVTAGLMPLGTDTATGYHDHATGYALRPNKPRPDGFASSPQSSPAEAPYLRTLQLHGCHRFDNAQFYRVVHSFNGGPEVPFVGLTWYTPRTDGTGNDLVSPDADGWYPILDADDYQFPHWLLNWPTGTAGRYDVKLEIADGAKNKIDESAVIPFQVDNTAPTVTFNSLGWREAGSLAALTPLDPNCPVIRRPTAMAIEIELEYTASAAHFRDVSLSATDCNGNALNATEGTPPEALEHWHIDAGDNNWSKTAGYTVPAGSVEGPYTVTIFANGRGFNPAGSDGGPGADWHYDEEYARNYPHRSICIINT